MSGTARLLRFVATPAPSLPTMLPTTSEILFSLKGQQRARRSIEYVYCVCGMSESGTQQCRQSRAAPTPHMGHAGPAISHGVVVLPYCPGIPDYVCFMVVFAVGLLLFLFCKAPADAITMRGTPTGRAAKWNEKLYAHSSPLRCSRSVGPGEVENVGGVVERKWGQHTLATLFFRVFLFFFLLLVIRKIVKQKYRNKCRNVKHNRTTLPHIHF